MLRTPEPGRPSRPLQVLPMLGWGRVCSGVSTFVYGMRVLCEFPCVRTWVCIPAGGLEVSRGCLCRISEMTA